MKKAILVVSFGTSYLDTLEQTIAATERELALAYPDWEVRRAFTSGVIIEKLRERDGLIVDNVEQAMQRLKEEGFTCVAVQPTHVIPGEEYEKMLAKLEPWRQEMRVAVGKPLLYSQEDYLDVASSVLEWLSLPDEDEVLVFMGHGSNHSSNEVYSRVEFMMSLLCNRILVATAEGDSGLDYVMEYLAQWSDIRKVRLAPFMLVAGDHARNDMVGDGDSWKHRLEEAGYEVSYTLQGLGQCKAVRQRFVCHCGEAVEGLSRTGKLWGVGVGPGDPELLTVKAIRVMKEADVIMVPDTTKSEQTALNIARSYIEGKELIAVKTPMVRDRSVVDAAYEEAARKIIRLLNEGKQVAFLTLGDPTVYSTYMYIHEKVQKRGHQVEVVPGITSFCAAAARLNISLCQGAEPLLVIPASHDTESLMSVPANQVYMKAGSSILELKKQLEEHGRLDRTSMVENCSMENEKVYEDFSKLEETSGYFSLVISKLAEGGKA